jgi:putative ABC transport system permease protein
MFRNYLTIALRNIVRHKLYSFINIVGLAVGLTCAIFVVLFIRDEISYDNWIPGSENLYRIESTLTNPGQRPQPSPRSPYPVAVAMQQQIPEVTGITHLTGQRQTVLIGNRLFFDQFHVVDPNFFQLIKLPLAEGDTAAVFSQPESIVLSQTRARKYFGGAEAVGKTITLSENRCDGQGGNCHVNQYVLKVTGVMRDMPHNSHLFLEALFPVTSGADPMRQEDKNTGWFKPHGFAYARLSPGADPNAVAAKMKRIIDRSADPKLLSTIHVPASAILQLRLEPFRDLHLTTDRYGGMKPPGSWSTLYGFAIIGILIQLVACFNFVNLATARATMRAREVSLRKVMGATRTQLVTQFLGESVLMSAVALLLALAAVEVLLPSFDQFLGRPIAFDYGADWRVLLSVVGLALASGLMAGIYPAFVLSGFRPAVTLRFNQAGQSGAGILRTALVVLQFAVSIGLGIAAMVILAQISFARNMELGFQKDDIVIVSGASMSPDTRESFMRTLRSQPAITGVSASDSVPFDENISNADVHVPGSAINPGSMRVLHVGPEFQQLYGLKLLAGRRLDTAHAADTAVGPLDEAGNSINVLVNEAAVKRLGFTPQSILGRRLVLHTINTTVVGVLADLRWAGTAEPVKATIYYNQPATSPVISIRVNDKSLPETLRDIDQTWRRFAPASAIQRYILSDAFDRQFRNDVRQGAIFDIFVGIAIAIACMGLFGLAAFTVSRRTKEIGVRKVFGARVREVLLLLLWQFSLPVLLANAIAWPIAWYYLHDWLQGFAYRVALSPLYFISAGLCALIIALATVFVHALHVARANPIHALRYE